MRGSFAHVEAESKPKETIPQCKTVRLRGNHNKYLSVKEDEISVTQDESSSSKNVYWIVEFSSESENKIRLKSCYGKYLTASNRRFILGLTGYKVLQTAGFPDSSEEWEPIQEGRNQVSSGCGTETLCGPMAAFHHGWIRSPMMFLGYYRIWSFGMLKRLILCRINRRNQNRVFSWNHRGLGRARSRIIGIPSCVRQENQTLMERFHNAKAVCLRSNHNKFLSAKEDEISVAQDESGSLKNACWTVEFSSESKNKIHLKSCYGKYLTASNKRFLLGMTGRKILQMDGFLDSSMEWQPIWEGNQVKLRTPNRKYLRANDNVWPWRDSVTHDIPYRTAKKDWILWDVDVVEIVSK